MKNHLGGAVAVALVLAAMVAAQESVPKAREEADCAELLRLETVSEDARHDEG